ncbi:MAG: hypothetical protein ACI90V_014248, partial [Bacillariaceae sp.]
FINVFRTNNSHVGGETSMTLSTSRNKFGSRPY